jgi:hypothetical protein
MNTSYKLIFMASLLTTFMVGSLDHPRAALPSSADHGYNCSSNAPVLEVTVQQAAQKRNSSPGEIASGSESSYVARQEIVLNIRPCRGEGELVVFRWPFRRTVVGSIKCPGGEVGIVQVEQL